MRASIVVPTHDHATTLALTVGTALAQTVTDLEVIVVGDGTTDAVRTVAEQLAREDPRVRFLDLPKGPRHGEVHRDTAVRGAGSDAIFYLCDDDLLMPRHVENLLQLLGDADLVQCRNGWIDPSGTLQLFPTDLADPQAIAWHLKDPPRNATSLTGTAHTRTAYLALPTGWTTTPAGQWPDHYMWKKFFREPGFRGATHPEMTAVQLPTSDGREDWDGERRLAELAAWHDRLAAPGAHDWLQSRVTAATVELLDRTYRGQIDAGEALAACHRENLTLMDRIGERDSQITTLSGQVAVAGGHVAALSGQVAALEGQVSALRGSVGELEGSLDASRREVESLTGSRSWRATAPLRGAARRLRRED